MLDALEKDCKSLKDQKTALFLQEIKGRSLILQGKIADGMSLLKSIIEQSGETSEDMGRLCADYAEILFENQNYEGAKRLMERSYEIFKSIKDKHRFDFNHSVNEVCVKENVKVMEQYQFPSDVMDQLSKKESKIRKDDKKNKEPTKKEAAKGKVAEEKDVQIQVLDT